MCGGFVTFYDLMDGTIVMVDISGLPDTGEPAAGNFMDFISMWKGGMHRGQYGSFADAAGTHYNRITGPILPMRVICLCWKETGQGPGQHFMRNALYANR